MGITHLAIAFAACICIYAAVFERCDPSDGHPVLAHRKVLEDSFTREDGTWSIRAEVSEVSFGENRPGELVRYTVRRDGVYVHSADRGMPERGRLTGCKYSFGGFSTVELQRIGTLGWIVATAGSCGANGTWREIAVVAPQMKPDEDPVFSAATFWSRAVPALRPVNNGIELWGATQEYGATFTNVMSIDVPFCVFVSDRGEIRRTPLAPTFEEWGSVCDAGYSFQAVFIAGLRELNATLMKRALDVLYRPADADRYAQFGLPETPAACARLVQAVEKARAALSEVEALVPQLRVADPVSLR